MTLAAVAGGESVWLRLYEDWSDFLDHVGVEYSHMKEAIARKGPFAGCKKDRRDWFVDGLITFFHMQSVRDRHRPPCVLFFCPKELTATMPGGHFAV